MDHQYSKREGIIKGRPKKIPGMFSTGDHTYTNRSLQTPEKNTFERERSKQPCLFGPEVLSADQKRHIPWTEIEKKKFHQYVSQTPRRDETLTKYWEKCALVMNTTFPSGKRNGHSCKAMSKRLSMAQSTVDATSSVASLSVTVTDAGAGSDRLASQDAGLSYEAMSKRLSVTSSTVDTTSSVASLSVTVIDAVAGSDRLTSEDASLARTPHTLDAWIQTTLSLPIDTERDGIKDVDSVVMEPRKELKRMDHSYSRSGGLQNVRSKRIPGTYSNINLHTPEKKTCKREISSPTDTTDTQTNQPCKAEPWILQSGQKHNIPWTEAEKENLRQYVSQAPRRGETLTKYWEKCALVMNTAVPSGKRNGLSCKAMSKRLSVTPSTVGTTSSESCLSMDATGAVAGSDWLTSQDSSLERTPLMQDVGTQTTVPFPITSKRDDIEDGDWVFMEPRKDLQDMLEKENLQNAMKTKGLTEIDLGDAINKH